MNGDRARAAPRIVTVGNVKGGVGKSTTAVQLALHAAARGLRVLLVDTDPGRSTLSWATRAGDTWPAELAVIAHPNPDLPRRLPALATGFDWVIIDTPGSPTDTEVSPQVASALAVATDVLIPTRPLPVDLDRLPLMLGALQAENNRRDLPWRILFTMVDLRSVAHLEARAMLEQRDLPRMRAFVPQRQVVAVAGMRRPLIEYVAVAQEVFTCAPDQVGTSA